MGNNPIPPYFYFQFFTRLIQAFRIVFPRVNNQKLLKELSTYQKVLKWLRPPPVNVLNIFKMKLIVSHYFMFLITGKVDCFPTCLFPSRSLTVKCLLPGCVTESVTTDSVSAGPYTDILWPHFLDFSWH